MCDVYSQLAPKVSLAVDSELGVQHAQIGQIYVYYKEYYFQLKVRSIRRLAWSGMLDPHVGSWFSIEWGDVTCRKVHQKAAQVTSPDLRNFHALYTYLR